MEIKTKKNERRGPELEQKMRYFKIPLPKLRLESRRLFRAK